MVETYTTDWQPQAEMDYDGLGRAALPERSEGSNRLAMTGYADGQSVTTQYALDGGQTLLATAGEMATAYLYGLGVIGEQTDAWSYALADGTNTPRQVVDDSGDITLTASYTPWGDILEVHGTGSFTSGYFGGVMDTATGLLYVGSGQYYDPQTGRFLNREARPSQTNPYVPWKSDPAGAVIAPLALLALVYGGKKKRGKWDNLIILLVLCGAVGMSLSACNPVPPQPPSQSPTAPTLPSPTSTPAPAETQPSSTPRPAASPTVTLSISSIVTCTATVEEWKPLGAYNISAYYITHESQYYFGKESISREIPSLDGISANKYFLFSNEGVCMQGTGRLNSGKLIGCTTRLDWNNTEDISNEFGNWSYKMPSDTPDKRDNIPFFFKNETDIEFVEAFETIAVCIPGDIPRDLSGKVQVRIKGISDLVRKYAPLSDDIFKATDTGGALCPKTIDLFIGEEPKYPEFDNVKLQIFPDVMNLPDLEVEMRNMR